MQSWKSPVYASGRIELNIIGDWISAVGTIANLLVKNPIYAVLLIGLSAIDAIPFTFPGLTLAEELIILYISYSVIKLTWARINGLDEKTVLSEFRGAEKRIVGVSFTYGIRCFLYGLLLVVPGIIFGIRSSIALAVTCLEELPINESFKRSSDLLKGNMWTATKYMFLMPLMFFIFAVGGQIGWSAYFDANKSLPSPVDLKVLDHAATFIFSFSVSMLQMCTASVMVRMYAYAKGRQDKGAAADAYVSGPETPKWDKS